ncbi:hypothetical protein QRD02_14320 [Aequorivita sp. SDUM287046]|uniref:DUF983 domain-containing protein n=1 Tax=Aequorivita aurantiaca TaxID=3053356 RepID=A0ABT8DR87_9FLAO|nr:hypothetical protein [Aequorivita aurantiaca]MDN3725557.1 hypothetical protein [Aequorivita aurantiaca]
MRVYYKCPKCNHENRVKTDAGTRIEFAMENGKAKKVECEKCYLNFNLEPNKFYAKESKLISILSGIIFFVGTMVGLYFVMQMISEMKTIIGIFTVACGLLIPVWIFGVLNKEERNRVKTFNQTYAAE